MFSVTGSEQVLRGQVIRLLLSATAGYYLIFIILHQYYYYHTAVSIVQKLYLRDRHLRSAKYVHQYVLRYWRVLISYFLEVWIFRAMFPCAVRV